MIIHNPRHGYMIYNTRVAGLGTIEKNPAPILCDLDGGVQPTPPPPPKFVFKFKEYTDFSVDRTQTRQA